MGQPGFQFKQFYIAHDRTAMKVNTDGILLGSWVRLSQPQRILDVGTGTGLIALMLAQRSDEHCQIEAIEIEADAYQQACENVGMSPWRDKINLHLGPVQNFVADSFDLLVSNPPYYPYQHPMDNKARQLARQSVTLGALECFAAADELLNDDGQFALIVPSGAQMHWQAAALEHGFYLQRRCEVVTRASKVPSRALLQFRRYDGPIEDATLLIYGDDGRYSGEFITLTRDFYLHM